MKKDDKHFSLRINKDLLKKFDYVANYDDRSMNWLLLQLVQKHVKDFETSHGKIPVEQDEK